MIRRFSLLVSLLLILLLSLNAWAWSRLNTSRQASIDSEQDAIYCRELADDVQRLKKQPAIAGSHEIELTELSKRIEQMAIASSISVERLVRISPETARPVEYPGSQTGLDAENRARAPYSEKPTTVLFSGVTLRQLATFLYAMSTGPAAMNVQTLRLSAPREDEIGDGWTAEVTLSYLIYTPLDEPSENRGLNRFSTNITSEGLKR